MAADLSITIGADVSQAVNGLKAFQSEVKTTGDVTNQQSNIISTSLTRSGKEVDPLAQRIRIATSAEHEFNSVLGATPALLSGMESPTQKLSRELTILSIGVQRARQEGQSWGEIFSSLGSSMFSLTGGITLVSTLLLTFGDKLFESGEDAKKTQEKIDQLTASLKYLNEEASRIGDLFGSESTVEVAKLKAAGASEQEIYEAQNRELLKKRELLRETANITRQQATDLVSQGVNPNEYETLKKSGEKLTGLFEEYDSALKEANAADKAFYDNEEKIQVLGYQNQQRIREDGLKKEKEDQEKAKQARQKELEELKKILEDKKKIIETFSKDFAAIGVYDLPKVNFDDDSVQQLAKELNDKLQKAITKNLPELSLKYKLDLKTDASTDDTFTKGGVKNSLVQEFAEFEKVFREESKKFNAKGFLLPQIDWKNVVNPEGLKESLDQAYDKLNQTFDLVKNGLGPAFESMFSAMENGQSGIKAFGQEFINTLKKMAAQLLTDIALAEVFSLLTGGGSTGFLTAFKALSGLSLPGHKDGLDFVPHDNYVARLHYGEMVLTQKDASTLRDSFNSLRASTKTGISDGKISRSIQGSALRQQVEVIGQFKAEGNDLIAVINRTARKQNRAF